MNATLKRQPGYLLTNRRLFSLMVTDENLRQLDDESLNKLRGNWNGDPMEALSRLDRKFVLKKEIRRQLRFG